MLVEIEYGSGVVRVELPDDAIVVRPGISYHEPEPVDAVQATERALTEPIGTKLFAELVDSRSHVAITFPDRVKGGTHEQAHRRVALRALLRVLRDVGLEDDHVRLVCAVGLHRKNSFDQMAAYLPEEILALHGARISNHDAEDPGGIVELGTSSLGDPVGFNRTCAEADLTVVLGHVQGNPYGGFSGGANDWPDDVALHRSASHARHDAASGLPADLAAQPLPPAVERHRPSY